MPERSSVTAMAVVWPSGVIRITEVNRANRFAWQFGNDHAESIQQLAERRHEDGVRDRSSFARRLGDLSGFPLHALTRDVENRHLRIAATGEHFHVLGSAEGPLRVVNR